MRRHAREEQLLERRTQVEEQVARLRAERAGAEADPEVLALLEQVDQIEQEVSRGPDRTIVGPDPRRGPCGKVVHPSRRSAESVMHRYAAAQRAYYCRRCPGWHLTKEAE